MNKKDKNFLLKISTILVLYFTIFNNASASNLSTNFAPNNYSTNTQSCWNQAASYHQVDPFLLYSIAYVESGFKPHVVGKNKNGSVDMGIMQINSIWLPTLSKYGITQSMLFEPCTSIFVGAWILSKNIKKFGYTWRAIGAYNSATPSIGYKYAKKVYQAHAKFTGIPTNYSYLR